ncbi:DUF4328 domain-containing protein [Streptomyces alanosinicus]|uniref:DUF4328 domain-containing protein n=1 Tax=Streptomyces alanosinicus TaxID=68171 RepID=A0A918YID0_9ACTN|nr:DUF4328 domain-containing protein [Streptomyces alanosinicus]GHE04111.1 hypothetical protein GCM10010339_34380 [Streptomyces alanosinicus]
MTEEEDIAQSAARTLAYQPVQVTGWLAAGGLLLAGLAWLARGVWEIRLAVAGEPAAGPPDQGDGVHRPLNSLEDSYHLVSSAGGVLVFLCAMLFLSWLFRLRDNARVLSGDAPKYAGIWVFAGWFVPVVNLWFPRGIVVDAFRGSVPGGRLPTSVNVWWGLWLVGMLTGVGIVYRDSTDQIIERAYTEGWQLQLSDAFVIAAAVAGAIAVRAVTTAQVARIRGLQEADTRMAESV